MKTTIFIGIILLAFFFIAKGQEYDDISEFGVYQKNWSLVKKDGLYGFIDDDGLEIVKPKYDDISEFGV
ncbi:MAG: hypothetical protein DRI84_00375, partial [Bacteroidetes bacterium]